MKQRFPTHFAAGVATLLLSALPVCHAQQSLTWEQVKSKFESANPSLKANALTVQEARAQEITAYLRPNPQFSLSADGTQIVPNNGVWKPFAGTDVVPNVSYLHERDHKREFRLESAKEGTRIAQSQYDDAKRNLEFTLRGAFVNALQAKAQLELANAELEYYDHIVRDQPRSVERGRYRADRLRPHRVAAGAI